MNALNIFLSLFFVATQVIAITPAHRMPATRKPSQASSQQIRIKVVYGEKTTTFVITHSASGGRVDFANNLGAHSLREISTDDYEFLKSKVEGFGNLSNDKQFCSRAYVEVSTDTLKTIGCAESKTKIADDVRSVVNLLSLMF